MNDDQQIGFQGDDDDMPPEMKAHMLAAFAHKAGVGPHPGMYKGPPRKKRDPDEPTDTDLQRAQEEPLDEEASARKMRAAMTGGGDLGPTEMETQQAKQTNALQKQATTQGAQQAQQAQSQMTSPTPPEAPGGSAGVSTPFPAQAGPQPQPPAMPPPPPGPGGPGGPDQEED